MFTARYGLSILFCCHKQTNKQDTHCTFNRKQLHSSLTVVAVEKKKEITYPQFVFVSLVTQHAMCYIFPCDQVRLYHIFPHYHITGTFFATKYFECKNLVLRFSLQLLSDTFIILRKVKLDITIIIIIIIIIMQNARYSCQILTLRLLMSYIYIYIYIYIYGAPILDVSRSHTTTQHSR